LGEFSHYDDKFFSEFLFGGFLFSKAIYDSIFLRENYLKICCQLFLPQKFEKKKRKQENLFYFFFSNFVM